MKDKSGSSLAEAFAQTVHRPGMPKNPCPQVRTSVQFIDPEWAARLLATNPEHQRNISSANLHKIESSIRAERFVLNGQTIIVDENGRLMDGQHRLQAIVNTGIGVWTVFVSNIPQDYFRYMDNGKARSFGDILKTTGRDHTIALAAAVVRLAEYLKNPQSVGSDVTFSHSELMEVMDMSPGLENGLRHLNICKHLISASQIAWIHHLAHPIVPDETEMFFQGLASGEGLSKTSPITLLRGRILSAKALGFHPPKREMQALVIKSWNHFMRGETLRMLQWQHPREPFPVLFIPQRQQSDAA